MLVHCEYANRRARSARSDEEQQRGEAVAAAQVVFTDAGAQRR